MSNYIIQCFCCTALMGLLVSCTPKPVSPRSEPVTLLKPQPRIVPPLPTKKEPEGDVPEFRSITGEGLAIPAGGKWVHDVFSERRSALLIKVVSRGADVERLVLRLIPAGSDHPAIVKAPFLRDKAVGITSARIEMHSGSTWRVELSNESGAKVLVEVMVATVDL